MILISLTHVIAFGWLIKRQAERYDGSNDQDDERYILKRFPYKSQE